MQWRHAKVRAAVGVALALSGCGRPDTTADTLRQILRRVMLQYFGRDTNTQGAQDLAAVEATLLAIRPYIRTIDNVTGFANANLASAPLLDAAIAANPAVRRGPCR